jgi:hypothetical protein
MNFEKDYEIINFEKFKNYKKYIPLYNNPNDDFIIIDLLNNSNDRINNIFNNMIIKNGMMILKIVSKMKKILISSFI